MKKLLLSLVGAVAITSSATTVTVTPTGIDTSVSPYVVETGNANFTLTAEKNNGTNYPAYNNNNKDLRVYAKGSLTIEAVAGLTITDIVFNLSKQGLERLGPIKASVGTIATQAKGDKTVTWSGENSIITFTVGDLADYGSSPKSAAQFDITDMVVTYVSTGTEIVLAPSISFDNDTDTVTITSNTEDAAIYYTIDGTTPTAESTLYTSPFVVEQSCTVKAIAVKGEAVSAVSTTAITVPARAYTIAEMLSKAPAKGDVVLVSCDLTVVYKYNSYVYVVDNAGGYTLLYATNSYKQGDVIPGGWYATYSPYRTLPEFIPQTTFPAATSTADVKYTTVDSYTEADVNKVVYLKNVTFKSATPDKTQNSIFTGVLEDGTEVNFKNSFYIDTVEPGTYTVLVAVNIYDGALQAFPIEYTPVKEDEEPYTIYVIGSNVNGNSWSLADEDAKFSYVGDGIYLWNGTVLASGFKFNDGSWGGTVNWGAGEESPLILDEEYPIGYNGQDIVISNFDDYILKNPIIELNVNNMTIKVHGTRAMIDHTWYFVGSYNNNVLNDDAKMTKKENGEYELASVLLSNAEGTFKISSENWSVQYGGEVITSDDLSVTLVRVVGLGNDGLYEIIPGEYSITWNPETAVITFTLLRTVSVEEIAVEEGEAVYYNLQGVKVANPTNGIYVKVTGNKSEKISIAD